ncbi:hypothetical protein SBDP2_100009 [Syntrophobacter sp. SbD2]|nr:hypothetical protein SBDP2_100009 [Syntrophobacter sp. SbD2]
MYSCECFLWLNCTGVLVIDGQIAGLRVIVSGACWAANASNAAEKMNTAAMAKHETNLPFFIPGSPPFVLALPAKCHKTARKPKYTKKNPVKPTGILVKFFP